MRIGCHGLVWTGSYDAAGIREAVRRTKDVGFDLIEFPLMDPATFDTTAARSALDQEGIVATGSLGLSAATDISGEEPEAVRAGEDLLNRAVDVLAALGSEHLCGIIYSAMRKYDTFATSRGVANSQDVIGRVARRAADAGITVSLEVTNRYESNVLNTARQARDFVAGIPGVEVGIHLDSYHMNIEETDMFLPILETGPQLKYVPVGESHRGYLGTGSVDLNSLFRALQHISFDGPVVFESFSSAVASGQLTRTLGIWRDLWDDGDELGRHALGFIQAQLSANQAATGY